jgi:DNA-binding IscR family transcriptional regulator
MAERTPPPAQASRVIKTVFQGGALTIAELAQLCDVPVSVAERVIAGLVKRGLVEEVNP